LTLKEQIPWPIKIGAKIVLARVPVSYSVWKKLGVFVNGEMQEPEYAFNVFQRHYEAARKRVRICTGFVGMELGPGDSLFSALIAKAFGAAHVYLVDVKSYAQADLAPYRQMESFLRRKGLNVPDLARCSTVEDVLRLCSATYLTGGLDSLRGVPAATVDFVWSQAVLEHIRLHEFEDFFRELRRIQRNDGIGSHSVDLKDHLGGALNNLRFSQRVWESNLFARSGFYTNRIRCREMLSRFERAGFQVDLLRSERFERQPTPRHKLSPAFHDVSDEDLAVAGFEVLLS
jgi:SAM-dependent methyltransferase